VNYNQAADEHLFYFGEKCQIIKYSATDMLSLVRLTAHLTLVHPTQAIEIFSNFSTPFGMMAIC